MSDCSLHLFHPSQRAPLLRPVEESLNVLNASCQNDLFIQPCDCFSPLQSPFLYDGEWLLVFSWQEDSSYFQEGEFPYPLFSNTRMQQILLWEAMMLSSSASSLVSPACFLPKGLDPQEILHRKHFPLEIAVSHKKYWLNCSLSSSRALCSDCCLLLNSWRGALLKCPSLRRQEVMVHSSQLSRALLT